MRRPDQPGTFRVLRRRDGSHMLTGVRSNGVRVKVPGLARDEADKMGRELFGDGRRDDFVQASVNAGPLPPLDDYGLPVLKASPSVIAATAPPVQPGQPGLSNKPEESPEAKAKKAKQAQSLMELAGIGWAAGSVWAGRKLTERAGCEPVQPSKQQVTDLRDAVKETFTDLFGDTEVKSWQLMILLTIALPVSMLIQSPKKSPEKLAAEKAASESKTETSLRSV